MLKHPNVQTFHINISSLLEKSSKSLWALLAVYKYIQAPTHLKEFEQDEIQGQVRSILMHMCSLADVTEQCLQESSCHYLLEWIETLCEIYIMADYHINQQTRPKIDALMKIAIEETLKIAGIDIDKIYSGNNG